MNQVCGKLFRGPREHKPNIKRRRTSSCMHSAPDADTDLLCRNPLFSLPGENLPGENLPGEKLRKKNLPGEKRPAKSSGQKKLAGRIRGADQWCLLPLRPRQKEAKQVHRRRSAACECAIKILCPLFECQSAANCFLTQKEPSPCI